MRKWIFFFLLIFCILVTSCATWAWTIFFILPLLVPNKTGRPKYYCFPLKFYSGMTYFTRQLNGWKRWLFVMPKFGSPRSRKSAPFKIYKIFAIHKISPILCYCGQTFHGNKQKTLLCDPALSSEGDGHSVIQRQLILKQSQTTSLD